MSYGIRREDNAQTNRLFKQLMRISSNTQDQSIVSQGKHETIHMYTLSPRIKLPPSPLRTGTKRHVGQNLRFGAIKPNLLSQI